MGSTSKRGLSNALAERAGQLSVNAPAKCNTFTTRQNCASTCSLLVLRSLPLQNVSLSASDDSPSALSEFASKSKVNIRRCCRPIRSSRESGT
jgi:hypothetical protein